MLVGRFCIFKTEWHDLIAVEPAVGDEGSMLLIWNIHWDLVVSRVGIYKAQQGISRGHVHQLVNPRKWKAVFWAGFVQVSEFHVGSPLAIWLLD